MNVIEQIREQKAILANQWRLPKSDQHRLKHRTSTKGFKPRFPERFRDYSIIQSAQSEINRLKSLL